ncbi:fimbrial biogenesis chaperone [Taklimakanibacter lacteus]|uniref:fimbrial biogenesis chaperone n=1 Tax=Taklimakanibacter lacteus TaxID=2268456 RepID=UPI0013C4F362
MLRHFGVFVLFATACLAGRPDADAASISVSPILIDRAASGNTAAVTLQTPGSEPVRVQLRVFRWTQVDGKDQLEPTRDVVASPPMLRIAPGTDYTVRVVRLLKRPAAGEESYRLLIDQLPEPRARKANQVNLVIRHSIPVFFRMGDERPPVIGWTAARTKRGLVITARNDGDRRFKLANLVVKTTSGKVLRRINGLAGYVLGHSAMSWTIPGNVAAGSGLEIAGLGEGGPFHGTSLVKPSP